MSNEAKKTVAVPSPLPGATAGPGTPATTQSTARPVSPAAPVAAPSVKPVAAFGGHRGGGKKREDGLVAGSPEAKEADRKKDAARKKDERDKKKVAALPPPLPGVPGASGHASDPVAGDPTALPAAAPGVAAVATAPLFVAWSEKILARPIKLLTRILDRVRCSALMQRVRKLGLPPAQEKEVETKMQFKAAAVDDFNAALVNCAAIELNKRRIGGAEHTHWVDVALTGGELVAVHLDVVNLLEKMIVEQAAQKKLAQDKSASAKN